MQIATRRDTMPPSALGTFYPETDELSLSCAGGGHSGAAETRLRGATWNRTTDLVLIRDAMGTLATRPGRPQWPLTCMFGVDCRRRKPVVAGHETDTRPTRHQRAPGGEP